MKMNMEHCWNDTGGENPKYSEKKKTFPSVTLSTINRTWTDLGSNSGLRSEKPNKLIPHAVIIAVCSEIQTKPIHPVRVKHH
jgi:hypothetical protein